MAHRIMRRCELIDAPGLSKCFVSKDGFSFSEASRETLLNNAIVEMVMRAYNVVYEHERLFQGEQFIAGLTSNVCNLLVRQQVGISRSEAWIASYLELATKSILDVLTNIFREYRHWPESHEKYPSTKLGIPVAFDHGWSFKVLHPRKLKTGGYTPSQIAITYPVIGYEGELLRVNAFVERYGEKNIRKRDREQFYEELFSVASYGWVDETALTVIRKGIK